MSPVKHPHTITPPPCFTVGTTHAEIICSPTLRLTKTKWLEPKISNLDTSDKRTDFHWSNVNWSCFLAQASLFFLLLSFSSGFFAAIRPWSTDSHSPLNSWCVCYLNSVKHLFGLQSEVQLTLMNLSSAAEVTLRSCVVAVLMRASFIIALDGFCDCKFLKCYALTDFHVLK